MLAATSDIDIDMAVSNTLRTNEARNNGVDVGRLVLRLALGLLILLHGVAKLSGPPDALMPALAKVGLPTVLAYGVYVGEVLAPILLILGVWTRAAALLIVVNMIFAVVLMHVPQLFSLGKQGGYALELQAMYLFTALAIALLGAGRYSIGGRFGPLN